MLVWFGVEVSAWDRGRSLTILQKALIDNGLHVQANAARVIAEGMSLAHAIWLNTLGKEGLERDTFDINWLDASLQVFVEGEVMGTRITMVLLSTWSEGATWCVKDDVLRGPKVGIDVECIKTMLESTACVFSFEQTDNWKVNEMKVPECVCHV